MFGWSYGGWMPLMGFLMIAFWALVVWGIVSLVRQWSDRPGLMEATHPPDARQVLDHRFAAGEIDEEEYRSRKAVLTGHRADRVET